MTLPRGTSFAPFLSRRTVLGGMAALAAAPLVRAQPESTAFDVIGVRDPQVGAQLAIAQHYNLFKDQGLNVTVRWTQSVADVLTIMGGGAAPVGLGGSFTQVLFGGQQFPIRTISALADISETQGLALGPNVKLSHPRELEGKRLAFTQGNSHVLMLAKLAKLYDFDHTKVSLINMNQSEGVVASARGDVHGLLGWHPNLHRLTSMGGSMYFTGGTLYTGGKPQALPANDRLLYANTVVMASQEWIDTKPQALAAFLRALLAANTMLASDRPRAMQALQQVLNIDMDALQAMVGANKYAMGIHPGLQASHRFQTEWALAVKRISAPPSPASCFTTKIAAMVDPSLVSWTPAA